MPPSSRPALAGGVGDSPLAVVLRCVAVPYRKRMRACGMQTMHTCWTNVLRTRISLAHAEIDRIWEFDSA